MRARDDGSVTIELSILFPALLLLVTALVQYGLWFHARSVALAAAQQGVVAAAAYQAPPGAGVDGATAFVVAHGSQTLFDAAASQGVPTPGMVRVEVSGRSVSLLPGTPGPAVVQSATAPVERFTVAGGP
ncbi:TadE/TadG family type IV pilus assembly protein [Actinotalea solisilvae]|uniref:TadE/TadG family type IV pilus assembly protein n=1 Tax=Actinotalea solisilvae TaxID=2072922 RepID=UPI0018F123F8